MINRKQFIEYKLKLASRLGAEGNSMTQSERAALITELTEVQGNIDVMIKQYEKKYNESYNKGIESVPNGTVSPRKP